MIVVEDLSRSFTVRGALPVRALDRVTLDVARGCVTGLLGPNAAGKTTLLRVIAGLLRPESGRASVSGYDVVSCPREARARIGFATEQAGLPDRLTPLWHVALHASLRGFQREEALRRARGILTEMGLGASMAQRHARLSGGTRMKVALARALVHGPPALLLDEPTARLDIETSAWARSMIRQRAEDGCAIILATHNPHEAERVCDEIVVLGRGQVLAAGAVQDVRRRGGGGPRLLVRLSRPAREVIEQVRRLEGAGGAVAQGDHLVFAGTVAAEAARLIASVGAAIGGRSILDFRHEEGSLEEAYHRIQRGAS